MCVIYSVITCVCACVYVCMCGVIVGCISLLPNNFIQLTLLQRRWRPCRHKKQKQNKQTKWKHSPPKFSQVINNVIFETHIFIGLISRLTERRLLFGGCTRLNYQMQEAWTYLLYRVNMKRKEAISKSVWEHFAFLAWKHCISCAMKYSFNNGLKLKGYCTLMLCAIRSALSDICVKCRNL